MRNVRRVRRAGIAGMIWLTLKLPRIFASWAGGRSRVIDDGQSCALGGLLLSATMGNKQPAPRRRLFVSHGGTSEHPEELTDRCCLSALAGLSKYLPLLGAWDIIASQRHYVNFGRRAAEGISTIPTHLSHGSLLIKDERITSQQ